jgi:hypothetical protein
MSRVARPAKRFRLILTLSLIGSAAIGVLTIQGGASANPADTPQDKLRAAFILAMRVHQGIQVPAVSNAGDIPTQAEMSRQVSDGSAAVKAIFADKPAKREISMLDNVMTSQQQGQATFRVLGGGIGAVNFDTVTVQGATASVHATVDAWSRMKIKGQDGNWHVYEPHNMLDVAMSFTLDPSNHWIVQTFDWHFAPGSEP